LTIQKQPFELVFRGLPLQFCCLAPFLLIDFTSILATSANSQKAAKH
jgi:hypothetical protein